MKRLRMDRVSEGPGGPHLPPPGQAEDEFSSGIYWCGKTSENFGPDRQPVGKTECCAGRSCYVG